MSPTRRLVAALLAFSLAVPALSRAVAAQTVIVVRHAERDTTVAGSDPPLSAAGQVRAKTLAESLARSGVSVILTSPLRRTVETAAPTAAHFGVASRPIAIGPSHVADVAAAVRAAGPSATVLVVGHSNTAPAIVAALGGKPAVDLPETVFDSLTTLVIDGASVREIDSRYGPPNPGG